jgi:N-acetylglutamate synthase-like GNAT family acetyltransferase
VLVMQIRRGQANDLVALEALLAQAGMGTTGLSPEDFLMAEEGEALVGTVLLQRVDGDAYLRAMAVDPDRQGRRLGSRLVRALVVGLDEVKLVARGGVAPFYQKLGFRATGWEGIASSMRAECEGCPDLAECRPVPMIYTHAQDAPPRQASTEYTLGLLTYKP